MGNPLGLTIFTLIDNIRNSKTYETRHLYNNPFEPLTFAPKYIKMINYTNFYFETILY